MVNDHVEHLGVKRGNRTQRVEAVLRMLAHDRQLVVVEPTWLFQDRQRNARLADIMKHSGDREALAVLARRSDVLAECHGYSRHQQAVLIGLAMVHADGFDPRGQTLRLELTDDDIARALDCRCIDLRP